MMHDYFLPTAALPSINIGMHYEEWTYIYLYINSLIDRYGWSRSVWELFVILYVLTQQEKVFLSIIQHAVGPFRPLSLLERSWRRTTRNHTGKIGRKQERKRKEKTNKTQNKEMLRGNQNQKKKKETRERHENTERRGGNRPPSSNGHTHKVLYTPTTQRLLQMVMVSLGTHRG